MNPPRETSPSSRTPSLNASSTSSVASVPATDIVAARGRTSEDACRAGLSTPHPDPVGGGDGLVSSISAALECLLLLGWSGARSFTALTRFGDGGLAASRRRWTPWRAAWRA